MRMTLCRVFVLLYLLPSHLWAQSVEELNRSGVEKVRAGDYDGAVKDLDAALTKSDKGSALVYHNIGISYEKEGNIKEAVTYFEEAIKRNPEQIESYEHAGLLNYKLGRHDRAVEIGQKGMELDPENEEIPKWLSNSFKKKTEKERGEIFEAQKKFRLTRPRTFTAGLSATGLLGLYNSPFSAGYVENAGFPPIGTSLYLEYLHRKTWGFRLTSENPYNGALMNDKLMLRERLELYYNEKRSYIGGGLLAGIYNGEHFGKKSSNYWDFKLGFVYGYRGNYNIVNLLWYPRLLPSDTGLGDSYTVDASLFSIEYIRAFRHLFDLYGAIEIAEDIYFDNKKEVSHYDGRYDFSAGCIFFNHTGSLFTLHLYLTERIYMQNYNNDRPYDSFNGQGFFGIDGENWVFGSPFTGVKTHAQILTVKSTENINENLTLYQQLSFEYVQSTQEKHELALTLGVEGGF